MDISFSQFCTILCTFFIPFYHLAVEYSSTYCESFKPYPISHSFETRLSRSDLGAAYTKFKSVFCSFLSFFLAFFFLNFILASLFKSVVLVSCCVLFLLVLGTSSFYFHSSFHSHPTGHIRSFVPSSLSSSALCIAPWYS